LPLEHDGLLRNIIFLLNLFPMLNTGCTAHQSFPATLFWKLVIGKWPKIDYLHR